MLQKKSKYRELARQLSISASMAVFCSAFSSSAQSGDTGAYNTDDNGYARHDTGYMTSSDIIAESAPVPQYNASSGLSVTYTHSGRLSLRKASAYLDASNTATEKLDIPSAEPIRQATAQADPFLQEHAAPGRSIPTQIAANAHKAKESRKIAARSGAIRLAAKEHSHTKAYKAHEIAQNAKTRTGHSATIIAQHHNALAVHLAKSESHAAPTVLAENTPVAAPLASGQQEVAQTENKANVNLMEAVDRKEQQVAAASPSPQVLSELPWLSQGGTKANANLLEAVDRKEQQVADASTPSQTSSQLPWLAQKTQQAFVNTASAQHPVTESVKIEPLGNSNTAIMPVYGQNAAPMPPVQSAPIQMPPDQTVPISEQSKNIIDSLPPEKPQTFKQLEPVNIDHARKSELDGQMEEKNHNGIGIKISVRQPKEDVAKMLEAAYDDLIAGDQGGAVELYRHVLTMQPDNKLALFGLATTYHRAGLLEQARPLYGKLLALDPHNVEGLNNFLVLLSDENPKDALVELGKLEKTHPSFSPIPAQMAIIYEKTGDYEKAAEKMNAAITLSPENLKYRYDMAIILDRSGDWADAAVFYKEILTASERGEKISANPEEIQQRLTFILSNRPKG